MQSAIQLEKFAIGKTGDNPSVGCVIVKGGTIIGKGWTAPPGGPHAEVSAWMNAISRGFDVIGATLYTTLEPCSFFGRTPACAASIVSWGIQRVIIGIRDPHPRVDGEGIRLLKAAGLIVMEGVCAEEIRATLLS
jgi:diaminohydroxyphosphoribosylaminopyrimidine deaminase/5-amino-6-(5-phosphoribosylamino)uracil reductase